MASCSSRVAGEELFNFCVSRDRLADFSLWILKPVVIAAVSNQDATVLLDGLNQFTALHRSRHLQFSNTPGVWNVTAREVAIKIEEQASSSCQ
jgi:hypothetical protein